MLQKNYFIHCFSNLFETNRIRKSICFVVALATVMAANAQKFVFKGSERSSKVGAIVVSADILKKDCKAKLLVGCNEEEIHKILVFLSIKLIFFIVFMFYLLSNYILSCLQNMSSICQIKLYNKKYFYSNNLYRSIKNSISILSIILFF